MRQVAPWLATGLVGTLVAVAAVLGSQGVTGPSPSAWVHRLLARTEGARTAHYSVTLSVSGPLQRLVSGVGAIVLFRHCP